MIENGDLKTNFNSSINNAENVNNESEKSESDPSEHTEQHKKCNIIKILAISAIIFVTICIILAVIIIVFVRHESTRPFKPEEIIGEIKCIYYIDDIDSQIQILSNEYKNISDIDITIDDKRVEFKKKYKFTKEGFHSINFYINKNETMDYMFADNIYLISVELYSRKNISIQSMVGSFQNCINLIMFKNDGFNTEQVLYMNDLFNNADLIFIDLENFDTSNVIDISRMFKDCKNLKYLNISNFNTENVINFSGFLEGCHSLINIDLFNFEIKKQKICQKCSRIVDLWILCN